MGASGHGRVARRRRLIIEPGTTTLASVLKKAGYRTAVVGKWHLGLGTGSSTGTRRSSPGPLELGFDECFIMAATGDRVPCVYIRDHRVVGLDPADPIEVRYDKPFAGVPTGKSGSGLLRMHPSHGHDMTIVNGISRIGYMKGGESALWKDETMADTFTHEAVEFIKRNQSRPFFLYFATHDIHVPRVPHPRFAARAGWARAATRSSSSTGPLARCSRPSTRTGWPGTRWSFSPATMAQLSTTATGTAVEKLGDHKPAGPFRGGKYSKFEGGTRVPFIVRWPGRVKPGTSKALVSQVDFVASFAALVSRDLFPSGPHR